tara:strand:- start:100217 stop:100891 length:675 start_codon:yes stop_codon:yes gene_type:complete
MLSLAKSYAQSPQVFSEIDNLSNGTWMPLTFKNISKHTDYQLVVEEGRTVVHASTENSASLLVTKTNVKPDERLKLDWCWKVSNVFESGDALSKSGDDYPARIYIAFAFDAKSATFMEKLKYNAANTFTEDTLPGSALNYIWANKLPVGQIVTNPYSEQTKMIAVQSGKAKLGQWECNSRDLISDYKIAFGHSPPPIIAIGIMSDSDNTGESAEAWYGDIRIED